MGRGNGWAGFCWGWQGHEVTSLSSSPDLPPTGSSISADVVVVAVLSTVAGGGRVLASVVPVLRALAWGQLVRRQDEAQEAQHVQGQRHVQGGHEAAREDGDDEADQQTQALRHAERRHGNVPLLPRVLHDHRYTDTHTQKWKHTQGLERAHIQTHI